MFLVPAPPAPPPPPPLQGAKMFRGCQGQGLHLGAPHGPISPRGICSGAWVAIFGARSPLYLLSKGWFRSTRNRGRRAKFLHLPCKDVTRYVPKVVNHSTCSDAPCLWLCLWWWPTALVVFSIFLVRANKQHDNKTHAMVKGLLKSWNTRGSTKIPV